MKVTPHDVDPNERPGRRGKRYLGIDLDTEMYREIAAIADADVRKVSDQVRLMLRDWLAWRRKRLEAGKSKETA